MNKKIIYTLCISFCLSYYASGQSITAMKLNEVLVINEENFVDDYGQRNGWVELFNNSPGTVNIAGCYLTDDRNSPKKYMIPKGDVKTQIKPRQHVLFWADGIALRGTFHVNFKLDPDKENYLALYNTDGQTLIDEIVIPAGQKPDISYGLDIDGVGKWMQLTKVTPDTNNKTLDSNEKLENFQINDAWGIGMTIAAMFVVFVGLILLYLSFKLVGSISISMSRKRALKASGKTDAVSRDKAASEDDDVTGEVVAAISAALSQMDSDVHDMETAILTIKRATLNYSPWSSKIYGLRQPLQK